MIRGLHSFSKEAALLEAKDAADVAEVLDQEMQRLLKGQMQAEAQVTWWAWLQELQEEGWRGQIFEENCTASTEGLQSTGRINALSWPLNSRDSFTWTWMGKGRTKNNRRKAISCLTWHYYKGATCLTIKLT
jgi:hypothetical protein